jgi:Ca2+-binding EF-hand superfamily protein
MRVFIASIVLSVAAAGASAHEGMHGPGSEYDADDSGSLSVDELKAYLKETKQDVSTAATRFASLDTNKDGKVSSAEFARGLQPKSRGL